MESISGALTGGQLQLQNNLFTTTFVSIGTASFLLLALLFYALNKVLRKVLALSDEKHREMNRYLEQQRRKAGRVSTAAVVDTAEEQHPEQARVLRLQIDRILGMQLPEQAEQRAEGEEEEEEESQEEEIVEIREVEMMKFYIEY